MLEVIKWRIHLGGLHSKIRQRPGYGQYVLRRVGHAVCGEGEEMSDAGRQTRTIRQLACAFLLRHGARYEMDMRWK
jgi:hypothetical protein